MSNSPMISCRSFEAFGKHSVTKVEPPLRIGLMLLWLFMWLILGAFTRIFYCASRNPRFKFLRGAGKVAAPFCSYNNDTPYCHASWFHSCRGSLIPNISLSRSYNTSSRSRIYYQKNV
eukprot:5978271-Amphidinium_carterae.2